MNYKKLIVLMGLVLISHSRSLFPTLLFTETEKTQLPEQLVMAQRLFRNSDFQEASHIFRSKVLKVITDNEPKIRIFEQALGVLRSVTQTRVDQLGPAFDTLKTQHNLSQAKLASFATLVNAILNDINRMRDHLAAAEKSSGVLKSAIEQFKVKEQIMKKYTLLQNYQKLLLEIQDAYNRWQTSYVHQPVRLNPKPVPAQPSKPHVQKPTTPAQTKPIRAPAPHLAREVAPPPVTRLAPAPVAHPVVAAPTAAPQRPTPRPAPTKIIRKRGATRRRKPIARRRKRRVPTKKITRRRKRIVKRAARRHPAHRLKKKPTYLRKHIDPQRSQFFSDQKIALMRETIDLGKQLDLGADARAAMGVMEQRILPTLERERNLLLKAEFALPTLEPLARINVQSPKLAQVVDAYRRIQQVSQEYDLTLADLQRLPAVINSLLLAFSEVDLHIDRAIARATDENLKSILNQFKTEITSVINQLHPYQGSLTRLSRDQKPIKSVFDLFGKTKKRSPRRVRKK